MPLSNEELAEILPVLFKLFHSNCRGRRCKLQKASKILIRGLTKCTHSHLKGQLGSENSKQGTMMKGAKPDLKALANPQIPMIPLEHIRLRDASTGRFVKKDSQPEENQLSVIENILDSKEMSDGETVHLVKNF